MAEGFVLDHTQSGFRAISSWVEGAPVKSVWTGLKFGEAAKRDIQTWRCTRCGFLESYAS